jgi:hypothetical protein
MTSTVTRRIEVEVVGDAATMEKTFGRISTAGAKMSGDLEKYAKAGVVSNTKQRESQRLLLDEYVKLANGAKKGSEEQRAAHALAEKSARQLGLQMQHTGGQAHVLTRDLERAGKGAIGASLGFKGLGRNIAFASGSFIGAAGFTDVVKLSLNAVASLEEQLTRTDKVFGTSAGEIKAWSQTSAEAMGLSRQASLDAANTVGTLLENVGKTPAEAAAMSKSIVQLAADMGAFKKVSPEIALSALESALQGRTRSLRQFGIVIDANAIKEEAYSSGIAKTAVVSAKVTDATTKIEIARAKLAAAESKYGAGTTQVAQATLTLHNAENSLAKERAGSAGQLTAQQKALATYNLLLKQTQNQQGTFKNSSGELAIIEQKLRANLHDVEAQIGQALLPTVEKYGAELDKWIAKEVASGQIQRDVEQAVHLVNAAVKAGTPYVEALAGAFHTLSDDLGGDKHAIELLIGAWITYKAVTKTLALVELAQGVGLIGTSAATSAGEVGGLRAALLGLGDATVLSSLGALGVAIGLALAAANIDSFGGYNPNTKPFGGRATHKGKEGTTVSVNKNESITFGADGKISKNTQNGPISGTETLTLAQAAKELKTSVNALKVELGMNTSGMSNDPMHDAGSGNRGRTGGGTYSQKDVYSLLLANGVPKDVAANLSRISMAESSGHATALNDNASTGDYSVGLFQENFIGKMGQQRVAKYAPQFNLSPKTSVKDFTEWLKQHPSAQAQIAYQIYQSQGYGAWSTAKGLGITGGGGGGGLNVGSVPHKPPTISGDSLFSTALGDQISRLRDKAKNAAAAGDHSLAATYLKQEEAALQKALTDVDAMKGKGTAKQQTAVAHEITSLQNRLDDVKAKITSSVAAALPQKLVDAVSRAANNAKNAGKKGNESDVVKYLAEEKTLLGQELTKLRSQTSGLDKKQAAAADKEITKIKNQIADVATARTVALRKIADAKFAAAFKTETTSFNAKLAGQDATYSAEIRREYFITGKALTDSYDVVAGNLSGQKKTISTEIAKLQAALVGKDPKQRALIQAQITKLKTALANVDSEIASNLDNEYQALTSALSTIQSTVSSRWGTYASEISSSFSAATQKLLDGLAADPSFFQNGAQTKSEASLAAMQAQDQLDSLNKAVTDAQAQLQQDMLGAAGAAGTATQSVQQLADGITLMSAGTGNGPVDPAAVQADQDAIAAAQRQLTEYEIGIQAQQERTDADTAYAAAVQKLTDQRAQQENELSKVLDEFGQGLQDGTLHIADLQGWLNGANPQGWDFGINLAAINASAPLVASDFNDLSVSSAALKQAFDDLAAWVAAHTGTPAQASVQTSKDLGAAQATAAANPTAANVAAAYAAAQAAGYTQSKGYLERAGILPGFATGAIVTRPTVAVIGEGSEAEGVFPLSRLNEFTGGGAGGAPVAGLTLQVISDRDLAARLGPYLDDSGSALVRIKVK